MSAYQTIRENLISFCEEKDKPTATFVCPDPDLMKALRLRKMRKKDAELFLALLSHVDSAKNRDLALDNIRKFILDLRCL